MVVRRFGVLGVSASRTLVLPCDSGALAESTLIIGEGREGLAVAGVLGTMARPLALAPFASWMEATFPWALTLTAAANTTRMEE